MGSDELALPTSMAAGGVSLGADTDRSRTARFAKYGDAGDVECSEKVVVGEPLPSPSCLGEDDFQPKKEENLDVGEFFLLLGEGLE